jgi:hypothetical protein
LVQAAPGGPHATVEGQKTYFVVLRFANNATYFQPKPGMCSLSTKS